MTLSPRHYTILTILTVGASVLACFFSTAPLLLTSLFASILVVALFLAAQKNTPSLFIHVMTAGTLLWIGMTVVYFFWMLPTWIPPLLSIALVLFFRWRIRSPKIFFPRPTMRVDWRTLLLTLGCLCMSGLVLFLLFTHASAEALRSPWETISPLILLPLLTSLICARFVARSFPRLGTYLLFLVLSILLGCTTWSSIYGYGFDPFIHEAAIRALMENNSILPKTPYYTGMYVLIATLARTGLPLHILLQTLGPLFGAGAMVYAWWHVGEKKGWITVLLIALFSPLPLFFTTTPFGLALALTLLTATEIISGEKKRAFLFALCACICHPIAGIPALCAVIASTPNKHAIVARGKILLLALGTLLFPTIAFLAQQRVTATFSLTGTTARLTALLHELTGFPYEVLPNTPRILLLALPFGLLICGYLLSLQRGLSQEKRSLVCIAWSCGIGGMLLATLVSLPNTISYELGIFPVRFFLVGLTLLAPMIAYRVQDQFSPTRGTILVLSVVLITFGYTTIPRLDPENLSHSRTLSHATLRADNWIHEHATSSTIVLANQTLAAADIWQYGFFRYLPNGEYWVAHPSGAPQLAAAYLDMMDHGVTRERIAQVQKATQANQLLFVIHDYWKNAPQRIVEARALAQQEEIIDSGKVHIFLYSTHVIQ